MENLSTLQALVQRLESLKHKECLLQLEQAGLSHWSGAQVAETARQLARGLVEAGVKPGEVVTILAHNRPEWVIAALGITSAGAVISPLDSQIRPEALERVLTDSQPRFIFTTTDYLNRLQQVELEPQPRLLLFDVESDDKRSWRALLSTASTPLPQVEPADQAALFYTSGTTGVPKGVPLTHHNLVFQIQAVGQANLLKDDDRVLVPLPMYHVYPFTVGTLTPLAFG
ncbi:MAG TPA: AMP-binding protein, partial [Anaerolineae bacterium]|nr:AMP-binding protein [Anaerolineae bacterium]